jgi:[amino group carrier protein]-lysine/ornithine hydrolase
VQREIRLLVDSLKLYTPSTKETPLSRLLQRRMRALGFKNVRSDLAGNAIGEVGSGSPHLLLCGHMDTVPGFIPVRREGDRVYGRGAADAKSPLCAMISAASSQRERPLHITMACVTREEGDSFGVKTLIEAGGDYDAAVFGEPGGAHRVAVGYRGRIEARLTVTAPGGHAGSSWAHQSAVDRALAVYSSMQTYASGKAVGDDHYRSPSVSLTMIRGGAYSNVIPRRCIITLDVRLPPGLSSGTARSDLHGIVEDHARRNPGVAFTLEFDEPTEAYEAKTDSPVVRAFQRSILTNLHARPVFTHKTGTGDMNTLAERMRIPCVTYGPGDSRLEHTDGEYVEITDYLNSVSVLRGFFREFRALSSR